MRKALFVIALAVPACACFGQVDRSKELKPIVTERPAVEHVYSCPDGYELKTFVKAIPTAVITNAFGGWYEAYTDHYQDAPTKDIVRTGTPTCVPSKKPFVFTEVSSPTEFVFQTSDGKSVTIHLDTGKVDLPSGYPADAAAKEFWESLKRYAQGSISVPAK